MELNELILDVFNLECKLFFRMDSYRLIEQKCVEKCLNPDEKELLRSNVHYVFERLIKTIKEACPELTEEDILFCCLAKSGLDSLMMGRCVGSVSRQSVNQRKYRIKKKMQEAECDFLFDMIFTDSPSPFTRHSSLVTTEILHSRFTNS